MWYGRPYLDDFIDFPTSYARELSESNTKIAGYGSVCEPMTTQHLVQTPFGSDTTFLIPLLPPPTHLQ